MKNVAIFQKDLKMGGIQKSLLNLLKKMDKYNVDLYLFDKNNFFKTEIPSNINIIYLKPFNKICKLIPFNIIKKIKKINVKKEYDIAIDFNGYSNECAIGALNTKSKKAVIWCHNDIVLKYKNEWKYRLLFNMFKSKYEYFDTVVCVSEGAKNSFIKKMGEKNKDIRSIPNYIDDKEIFEKSNDEIDINIEQGKYNLISVGRICHQKGFDILIDLMKKISIQNKRINLYIIGDGPDFKKIKRKIKRNKLEKDVFLLRGQKNPFKYMSKMDGFILTSRYEGQGMVILEAKALGLQIFIPKHLELYVEEINGYDNIIEKILNATKKEKKIESLDNYNKRIEQKINYLLENQ